MSSRLLSILRCRSAGTSLTRNAARWPTSSGGSPVLERRWIGVRRRFRDARRHRPSAWMRLKFCCAKTGGRSPGWRRSFGFTGRGFTSRISSPDAWAFCVSRGWTTGQGFFLTGGLSWIMRGCFLLSRSSSGARTCRRRMSCSWPSCRRRCSGKDAIARTRRRNLSATSRRATWRAGILRRDFAAWGPGMTWILRNVQSSGSSARGLTHG